MKKIIVEFYHDTICSFCFPMSYRMRQVKAAMTNVEIIHRSFALVPREEDFERMFASREVAKSEIMSHWEHANANDDLHRFNIQGMMETDFLFPYSMPALVAAKAAGKVGGEAAYWDVFDGLQTALFSESKNIQDAAVIESVVKNVGVDVEQWMAANADEETLQAVYADLMRAQEFGVHSAPTLIINEKLRVSGAQPLEVIVGAINQVAAEVDEAFQVENSGGTCKIGNDGRIDCD